MGNKNLQEAFIKNLNEILTHIDFAKLDTSCNSDEDSYAKETLKKMHDAFAGHSGVRWYLYYRLNTENFFGKNDIITRGEFVADLAKELEMDTEGAVKDPPTFSDIDGHWAEKYIEALIAAGIINPADYPDDFKPDEPITRAEIIKMMVRVKGQDEEAKNTQGYSGYDDHPDIKDGDKGYPPNTMKRLKNSRAKCWH